MASRETPKKCARTMTWRRLTWSEPAVTSWNFCITARAGVSNARPNAVRVAFLPRVGVFMTVQDLRLPARREEMPRFVRCRLDAPLARMVGVDQHARTERFVICEETGNAPVEPPDVDAHAHLHLEQRHDVLDGRVPQTEALPQLRGVVLGLRADIALQERPLGRIIAHALDTQQVLQFHLRTREAR